MKEKLKTKRSVRCSSKCAGKTPSVREERKEGNITLMVGVSQMAEQYTVPPKELCAKISDHPAPASIKEEFLQHYQRHFFCRSSIT